MRLRAVPAALALSLLAGCTAVPVESTPAPVVETLPGDPVEPGSWAVVAHTPTSGDPAVLALRIVDVTRGERGDLDGVTGAERVDRSVPLSVDYAWTVVAGDEPDDLARLVRGAEDVLGGDVVTVAHRDLLGDCTPPPAGSSEDERYGCVVIAGAGSTPNALAVTTGAGADPVLLLLPEAG